MSGPDQVKAKSGSRLFRHPSITMLVVCALFLGGTLIYAHFTSPGGALARATKPVPSLDQWFADLNAFHSRFSSYPASLRELEKEIWIPARKSAGKTTETQLQFGPRMFLYNNYAYLYQRDAQDASICSLWAIPQGEHYLEGYTYYEVITPKTITEWKGGALTPDQMRQIPPVARPTGEQMANLGMFIQHEVTDTKQKRGGLLSIFN